MIITRRLLHRAARAIAALPLLGLALCMQLVPAPAIAADTLNVYSIWPENWAAPSIQSKQNRGSKNITAKFHVRKSSAQRLNKSRNKRKRHAQLLSAKLRPPLFPWPTACLT